MTDDPDGRLVARIGVMHDGFHISVPYHPALEGILCKMPLDYSKTSYVQPFDQMDCFKVDSRAKLSLHMNGFVQFSSSDTGKIISGFCQQLKEVKGVGLRAPTKVDVTTGPLCGVIVQGLHGFKKMSRKPTEVFGVNGLWHHPSFCSPADTAYNLEFFLLRKSEIQSASLTVDNKQLLRRHLPFKAMVKFPFELRVLELPHMPFFLGLIISHVSPDSTIVSGYKISGPGCFDQNGDPFGIFAGYPRPACCDEIVAESLNYEP